MSVFRYDLVRTTRRGRAALLRSAYALALLVALGGVFARWFPEALKLDRLFTNTELASRETARFAEDFVATCLLVQFAAAVLLTPIYAAGAIAEERQRGTLDGLLVTDLSGGAIVAGKFAARWLTVAGLLLTGLPVLAVAQLWGGVDWRMVAFGFGVTFMTTLSISALSVLVSIRTVTVLRATVLTYAMSALLTLYTWKFPFDVITHWNTSFDLKLLAPPFLLCVICHSAVTLIALVMAAWLIRPQPLSPAERDLLRRAYNRLPAGSSLRVAIVPHLLVGAPPPWSPDAQPPRKRVRILPIPPIGDDPVLWKELHFGGAAAAGELLRIIAYGLIGGGLTVGLTFLLTVLFGVPRWIRENAAHTYNSIARDTSLALLTIAMIGTALRAAASVSREHERRTLDSLRVLPAGPESVLWAKWLGSLLRMRWLAATAAGMLLVGVMAGGVHPAAVVWLALAAIVHAGFLASLGLFFSVTTGGVGRSAVATLVGLMLTWTAPPVLFGYWLGLAGKSAMLDRPWLASLLQEGLTPPLTWRFLAFAGTTRTDDERLIGVMVGLAVYAAAAWVLWRLAAWRFRRNG